MGVSKTNGTPKWMVYNPIKMDDLGVPLFLETPKCMRILDVVLFPEPNAWFLSCFLVWQFALKCVYSLETKPSTVYNRPYYPDHLSK